MQVLLAQTEKSYFETKLKLDRVSGEKQALLQENRSLEGDRDDLRQKLRQITEENVQIKERWVYFIGTLNVYQVNFGTLEFYININ